MNIKRFIIPMILACVVAIATGLVFADDRAASQAPVAAASAIKPDPSGARTGSAADVVGATTGAPTAEDIKNLATSEPLAVTLAEVIGRNRIVLNVVWP